MAYLGDTETKTSARKLLLVEDDEDDYVLVREFLSEFEDQTYELHWVDNHDQGLERLLSGDFDICLLDYRLGARTGIELLRAARAAHSRVPVVFLTDQADRAIDMEAMDSGAMDYLLKRELTPSTLERSLRYALERASSIVKLEELARELHQARDRALRASEAKSQFLSRISHELRTPLSAIIAYSELIQVELGKQGLDKFNIQISEIRSTGEYLHSLIDELLDRAKVESGTLDVRFSSFAIVPMLEETVATILPLVDKGGNRLHRAYDDTGSMSMVSDPLRVRQILINLLSNACKFTTEGQIELGVRAIERACPDHEPGADESWLEFRVVDTGIGMSPAQQARLFQDFSQVHTDAGRYGGTGLGLAISQRLARLLGGEILVESAVGTGSVFRLVLPCAASTQQP